MVKKKMRIALMAVLAAVFCVSGVVLLRQLAQYREGAQEYAEAESLAGLPDFSDVEAGALPPPASSGSSSGAASSPAAVYVDPYADALAAMDFTALREVNADVLGWILIPGTRISYPMVQGADNQYYLNHTWKKWSSVVGAIFLECTNQPDFSDFNTIIYGHRMNNGSMFAGLRHYKDRAYWASHPAVYITDDGGTRKYDIFAAYEVSTQGETYRVGLQSETGKQSYIDYCLAQSRYDTGVVPTVYDRIITLSTCTGNGHATRWVVQARLLGEPPAEDPADAAVSADGTAPADAAVSADGTIPADAAAPADGTAPADTAASADGTIPADAAASADGTAPTDTAASADGTIPADETAPDNNTVPASSGTT